MQHIFQQSESRFKCQDVKGYNDNKYPDRSLHCNNWFNLRAVHQVPIIMAGWADNIEWQSPGMHNQRQESDFKPFNLESDTQPHAVASLTEQYLKLGSTFSLGYFGVCKFDRVLLVNETCYFALHVLTGCIVRTPYQ